MIQHFYHFCLVVGLSCSAMQEVPNGCLPLCTVGHLEYATTNVECRIQDHQENREGMTGQAVFALDSRQREPETE
ncbi:MAG: hypothetical protein KDC44_05620 [Phaeodactylibacter sp.]|nr:hypothetical protein [Phaeodactylibacter sp.]